MPKLKLHPTKTFVINVMVSLLVVSEVCVEARRRKSGRSGGDEEKGGSHSLVILVLGIAAFIILLLVACFFYVRYKRRVRIRKRKIQIASQNNLQVIPGQMIIPNNDLRADRVNISPLENTHDQIHLPPLINPSIRPNIPQLPPPTPYFQPPPQYPPKEHLQT
ncbi:unnamed protein product [Moneuplotes crassus]|uniref:Uncharacterized protein n=1 Tax=Euplotes crassus TaxID=5936 RepID=A0AAD1XXT3_EUPCR|nr:unnamed protein product [Moneuplotes crassus]